MHWINMAQDKDKWPAPVNKAVKIRVPSYSARNCEELMVSQGTLCFCTVHCDTIV